MQSIDEQLNALKSGMVDQIHVSKEEFLAFREVLVKEKILNTLVVMRCKVEI